MLFPSLTFDTVLQVEDKFRLDASRSFVSDGSDVTDILIKPSSTDIFISVMSDDSDDWFLDWAYESDGYKEVSVKIVTSSGDKTKTYLASINVLTKITDALLSNDNDLFPLEPSLNDYLPRGRSSFIYAHRKAQERILAYLDEQRIWRADGNPYGKLDLVNVVGDEFQEQFNQWSIYQTLLIIFESSQVTVDDVYKEKMNTYKSLRNTSRDRGALRLDKDGDNIVDDSHMDRFSTPLVRR